MGQVPSPDFLNIPGSLPPLDPAQQFTAPPIAPPDRAPDPWMVEDRTSYYRAMSQWQIPGALPAPPPEPTGHVDNPDYANPNASSYGQEAIPSEGPGLSGILQAAAAGSTIPGGLVTQGLESIPTGGGTTLGERIENAPAPVRIPAQFALNAAPYVAADVASGGALTPAYIAQAGLQSAAIADQYEKGQIDGKTALEQIALTVGPFLVAPVLHHVITAGGKLGEYAQSAEGRETIGNIQTKLASERGGGPPEGQIPPEEGGFQRPSDVPVTEPVYASRVPEAKGPLFPETTPDPLAPVTDWLQQANVLREKQTQNVAEMRKAQAGRIADIQASGPATEENLNRQLAAARGAATKENMWIPSDVAEAALPHGLQLIQDSTIPELGAPQAKMNLQNAWRNWLLTGELPQVNQLDKMETVFGKPLVTQMRDFAPKRGADIGNLYTNGTNFVKTLKTIIPLHGMLRAGVFEAPSHPLIWLNQFVPQIRALINPEFANALMEDIHSDPAMHSPDGLGGLDMRADGRGPRLKIFNLTESNPLERDEGVMSQWADHIPGVTRMKNSYLVFRNNFSRDIYKAEAENLKNPGFIRRMMGATPEDDPAAFDRLAEHIDHGTGWSRFNISDLSPKVNPFFSLKRNVAMLQWPADLVSAVRAGDRNAAIGIAKDLVAFTGTASTGLALLNLAGPKMGVTAGIDPFSSDFGKVKVGNERIDTMGGSAQVIRAVAQLMSGRTDSGGQQYATSRQHVITNFIRNKLEPIAGAAVDYYTGSNVVGQNVRTPSGALDEAANAFAPIVVEELVKAAQESGAKAAAIGTVPSILGAGVQTYGPSTGSRAGFLNALGLDANATPQQIYEASQKNPDAVKAYQDAQMGRDTTSGKYESFVQQALTGQKSRDDALTSGKDANGQPYSGSQWRDDLHAMEESLAGARKFAGLTGTSSDPVVKGYDDIFAKFTNPDGTLKDKTALYDALDQYRAGLNSGDQSKLDSAIGWSLNQTPMMREYRDTTKSLNDKGFFGAAQNILKQSGVPGDFHSVGEIVNKVVDGLMASAPPHDPSGDDALRQLITNKVAPRFNKLDQMINLYKLYLVKDDPKLESEAVKFGLIRTKAALLMDLANSQAAP